MLRDQFEKLVPSLSILNNCVHKLRNLRLSRRRAGMPPAAQPPPASRGGHWHLLHPLLALVGPAEGDHAGVDRTGMNRVRGRRSRSLPTWPCPVAPIWLRHRRRTGEPLRPATELPRRPRTLPDWRRAAKQGDLPSHSPQSALTRQTNHQSEEPAETRGMERRLSGNRHPPDRLMFKRFPSPL
jgi:hypothetical protein